MTEVDRPAFAEALFALGETFNEPVTEIRAEAYFDALGEFDVQSVTKAIRLALRQCRFMPRPADLRELIEGNRDEAADAAWGAVLGEIRRVGYIGTPNLDDRTQRAVRELWGSWQRLCETLPAEGPELVGWVKQFKGVYGSVAQTDTRKLTMGELHPNVRQFIDTTRKRLK